MPDDPTGAYSDDRSRQCLILLASVERNLTPSISLLPVIAEGGGS